jgi:hypothetical protein
MHNLFGLNQDGLIISVREGLITAVRGNNNVAVISLSNLSTTPFWDIKAFLWLRDLPLFEINVFHVRMVKGKSLRRRAIRVRDGRLGESFLKNGVRQWRWGVENAEWFWSKNVGGKVHGSFFSRYENRRWSTNLLQDQEGQPDERDSEASRSFSKHCRDIELVLSFLKGIYPLRKDNTFRGTRNVSDALTKSLPWPAFEKHKEYMIGTRVPFAAFYTSIVNMNLPLVACKIQGFR